MPLSFPTNPTIGQTYRSGSSAIYQWNGSYWFTTPAAASTQIQETISSSLALTASYALSSSGFATSTATVLSSVPSDSQKSGSLWWNSNNGNLYIQTTTPTGSNYVFAVADSRTSISASYATSASYLIPSSGSTQKEITSISQTGYAFTLLVADGKLYAIKSSDGGYDAWPGALYPNSIATGLQRGVQNMYEIVIPNETGSLVSANTYGTSAYALYDNGSLYTWGNNSYGQLGNGGVNTYYPTLATTNVVEVYTHRSNGQSDPDYTRLIIKKTDGKIYGCGYNGHRELGLANTTNQTSFVELPWAGTNPLSVWNIGAFRGNMFVQKSNGEIWVAGYNGTGEIGDNSTTQPTAAKQVSAWLNGDSNNRIIDVLAGHRACDGSGCNESYLNTLILSNGTTTTMLSSGYNFYGSIGDGSTTTRLVPTAPSGSWTNIRTAASVGGAYESMYVVKEDNTFWIWGYNGVGQLGNTSTTTQLTPSQLTFLGETIEDIIPVTQGVFVLGFLAQSPIIKTTGGYYMCGKNDGGYTGTGQSANNVISWTKIRLQQDIELKFVGCTTTINEGLCYYAVDTNNQIWSWGYNADYSIDAYDNSNYFQPINIQPSILKK